MNFSDKKNTEGYSIKDIESMNEAQAASMATEKTLIKGHTVYFVDFPGAFGYSALVFADIRHIYYANEYSLDYRGKSREELHEIFVRKLENKLFTEDEICGSVADYDEYRRKDNFLRNYYTMRRESISVFGIFVGEEGKKKEREIEQASKTMFYNPVGFSYCKDKAFVQKCMSLMNCLTESESKLKNDFNYWKNAFMYEMYNHEFTLTWDDFSVLSSFGNLTSQSEADCFEQLGFTEVQKEAYLAARKDVLKSA